MAEIENPKIGGMLLAAGGSSRFGSPKQLAEFEGRSLIARATESLVESVCDPIVVVLGAEIEGCRTEIAHLPIIICVNTEWATGMSSSIRRGLSELLDHQPRITGAVVTLCDQPYVTSNQIDLLTKHFIGTGAGVVAADYNGVRGVPALFSSTVFQRLLTLKGDKGARDLIREVHDVAAVPMREPAFDIDTPDDL